MKETKQRTRIQFHLTPIDNKRLANLCGKHDEHLRQMEKYFDVEISNRGHEFSISGSRKAIKAAHTAISRLYDETQQQETFTPEIIHLNLAGTKAKENIVIHTKHCTVKARSTHQQLFLNNIANHPVNFGIGPAGTGKTYLAVACAVTALESELVERVLLVRPVVEAGEHLGFLPGTMMQKVDPYFRPLYDALFEMLGFDRTMKLIENNTIEVAPLAYMRGRTLNRAFIILDEAQNTTCEQMKMFLTRIGFGSIIVITGDVTQVDLPKRIPSGLKHSMEVLNKIEGVSFTHFDSKDIVRHPVVQSVIRAYELHEKNSKKENP